MLQFGALRRCSRQPAFMPREGFTLHGISQLVIASDESRLDIVLGEGVPFGTIPEAGWPLAECRSGTTGDITCEKNLPPSVSLYTPCARLAFLACEPTARRKKK